MAKRKKTTRKQVRKVPVNCGFCKSDKTPSYKEYADLSLFLTDRAKIIGKNLSGVCSKHQRALGKAINRARHLGLLPFSPTI